MGKSGMDSARGGSSDRRCGVGGDQGLARIWNPGNSSLEARGIGGNTYKYAMIVDQVRSVWAWFVMECRPKYFVHTVLLNGHCG